MEPLFVEDLTVTDDLEGKDRITYIFGDYDTYYEFAEGMLSGDYMEVKEPVLDAIAAFGLEPEFDTDPDTPEGEQVGFESYDRLIHFGRVITKPEGVDLPGELVVTSYDPDWENPRLTTLGTMPAPEAKVVHWFIPFEEE